MFAVLHSDINSPMSGLLHLTGQPYCKKSRSAKVKDEIINLFLRNYLVDRYIVCFAKKIVSCRTVDPKPVKQEVNGTVIHSPLVFLEQTVTDALVVPLALRHSA
jgi:hypothetical protein